MPVIINPNASENGLRAVELEDDWFRVTVLPDVGAKIYDLWWKPAGRQILWHNPRILPQPYPIDGNFDNYWCGGRDDGFPTCDACEFNGELYPNLGELRSVRWKVASVGLEDGGATVRLTAFGPMSPVRAEKTVTIDGDAPVLRMRYGIENLGPRTLDFIWGTHPALQPSPHMILRIPAKTGIVGQSSAPSLGDAGQRYAWPILETLAGRTDMSCVQPVEAGVFSGHYATDLEAGWYAAEDAKTGEGFLLSFPLDLCPYLWMWLVYGGWRGYHHVVIEPWTSYPNTLTGAHKEGTARRLAPGEKFAVEVRATVYAPPEMWQGALRRVRSRG